MLDYTRHSAYSELQHHRHMVRYLTQDYYQLSLQLQGWFNFYTQKNFQAWQLNLRSSVNILDVRHSTATDHKSVQKVAGICRDVALLFCAVLRERGINSRLRVGYINYVIPNFYLEGVYVEFLQDKRWYKLDVRTTPIEKKFLRISPGLIILDDSNFISAARAWLLVRENAVSALKFGSRQHQGLHYMRNRLIQDLAMLNQHEVLLWDIWGRMFVRLDEDDLSLYDDLAKVLLDASANSPSCIEFYQSQPDLQFRSPILCDNPYLKADSPLWL